MFFRRRSPSVAELYEARIEDLKEAHEARVRELMRVVDALAEQIEYLRALNGTPHISSRVPATPGLATTLPHEPGLYPHLTDEEEDLLAMRDSGLISDAQMAALREALEDELGPGVLIS